MSAPRVIEISGLRKAFGATQALARMAPLMVLGAGAAGMRLTELGQ